MTWLQEVQVYGLARFKPIEKIGGGKFSGLLDCSPIRKEAKGEIEMPVFLHLIAVHTDHCDQ